MKNYAFSLIELIITIAIISILAVIAYPSLGYIKNQAMQAKSTSNIRQLAIANISYAADNGDRFCPAEDGSNLKRWHGSRTSTNTPFDPTSGFLSDYLGQSRTFNQCPAFISYATGSDSFETGAGGYGYNAAYIGGRDTGNYVGELGANLRYPAKTIMFATTAYPSRNGLQEYPYVEPFMSNDGYNYPMRPSMHFRFRGRSLVGWCDGHVTAESQKDYPDRSTFDPSLGWIGPTSENGYWNALRP